MKELLKRLIKESQEVFPHYSQDLIERQLNALELIQILKELE